jgi:hypothetical protein
MSRVTSAEVAAIASLPNEASQTIISAMQVASTLVAENLTGLSEATLKSIELFLAAHFSTLSWEKGPLAAITIGEATERYHDIYSGGLSATRFGQQAIMLDTTGALSEMSANAAKPMRRAEFEVVGTIDMSTDEG